MTGAVQPSASSDRPPGGPQSHEVVHNQSECAVGADQEPSSGSTASTMGPGASVITNAPRPRLQASASRSLFSLLGMTRQRIDRGPVMAASRAIGVSRSNDEGSRMTAETTFPAMTCGACSRFGPTVTASYKTPDPLCPLKHRTTSAYERAISILPIDRPGHLRRNKLPVMMHHFEELVRPTSRSRVGRFILVYFLLESHRRRIFAFSEAVNVYTSSG